MEEPSTVVDESHRARTQSADEVFMGLQSRGGREQFYKSAVDFGGRRGGGGADLRENIAGSPLKANARQQTNKQSFQL